MELSISKCIICNKQRLVDKMPEGPKCFACKQKGKKNISAS